MLAFVPTKRTKTYDEFVGRFIAMAQIGEMPNSCWIWQGVKTRDYEGYGRFRVNNHLKLAHRVAYEMHCGPVPPGRDLDHLCHDPKTCVSPCPHRLCVNPDHLEAVTPQINYSRGKRGAANMTHCKHGHPFNNDTTFVSKRGLRICRACYSARSTVKTHCKAGHLFEEKTTRISVSGRRICAICTPISTHCKNGHTWENNTYITAAGHRTCRECRRNSRKSKEKGKD